MERNFSEFSEFREFDKSLLQVTEFNKKKLGKPQRFVHFLPKKTSENNQYSITRKIKSTNSRNWSVSAIFLQFLGFERISFQALVRLRHALLAFVITSHIKKHYETGEMKHEMT